MITGKLTQYRKFFVLSYPLCPLNLGCQFLFLVYSKGIVCTVTSYWVARKSQLGIIHNNNWQDARGNLFNYVMTNIALVLVLAPKLHGTACEVSALALLVMTAYQMNTSVNSMPKKSNIKLSNL